MNIQLKNWSQDFDINFYYSSNEEKTKDTLPYCWAVTWETLRFFPQTGFGTPHHSEESVFIDGFEIPARTDVYPDLLGILR